MKAYMTRSNADMTEGRGPMQNEVCFKYRKDAEAHIDNKSGIMGRRPASGKWSTEKYGDWDIVEIEIHESLIAFECAEEKKLRTQALAKLTPEERKALGLPLASL